MSPLSRAFLLIALCGALAGGCSGGVVSVSTTGLGPSMNGSLAGNWAMTSPSSIGLVIFQSGSSLTVLFNGSPCSGIMSPISLQGTVTGTSVTLSGSGISIIAIVSLGSSSQTLSGTFTCGVSIIQFTAINVGDLTGQWKGTFTATSVNAGAQTAVGANLDESLNPNNFPTLTGNLSFSKLGATESCLASAGGGPITRGEIRGTSVFIQATSTVNSQTVTMIGVADPTGHFINVTSYSIGCGTGEFVTTETGTGNLSRQ